jgi:hypothetical protein
MLDVRYWMFVGSVRGELVGRGPWADRGLSVFNGGSLPRLPGLVILENYLR